MAAMRPYRTALLAGALVWAAPDARAADPAAVGPARPIFMPTAPDGVASELPRSPLGDVVVNGAARFARADEARLRCRGDVVVWVETGSNTYRLAAPAAESERWLGAYMCQADATAEGDRPSM